MWGEATTDLPEGKLYVAGEWETGSGAEITSIFPADGSDADLKAEYRARALYREARDVAEDLRDYVSKDLFEKVMDDEEGHIDFLETQIDLYERIGEARYGLLNATPADDAD